MHVEAVPPLGVFVEPGIHPDATASAHARDSSLSNARLISPSWVEAATNVRPHVRRIPRSTFPKPPQADSARDSHRRPLGPLNLKPRLLGAEALRPALFRSAAAIGRCMNRFPKRARRAFYLNPLLRVGGGGGWRGFPV